MKNCLSIIGFILITSFVFSSKFIGILESNSASIESDSVFINDELTEFRLQGADGGNSYTAYNNPNGWGLFYYNRWNYVIPTYFPNQLFRSEFPALEDENYIVAVDNIFDNISYVTNIIGHVRKASSGSVAIPNPHPFIYSNPELGDSIYTHIYTFAHNGTIAKTDLLNLLTDNQENWVWINNNPPQSYGCGNWNEEGWDCVVDSELYFFWLLKNIGEENNILNGIIKAVNILENADLTNLSFGIHKNFVLSDGKYIYAYRSTVGWTSFDHDVYYFDGRFIDGSFANHKAVMSHIPACGNELSNPFCILDWKMLDNFSFLILSPTDDAIILQELDENYLFSFNDTVNAINNEILEVSIQQILANDIFFEKNSLFLELTFENGTSTSGIYPEDSLIYIAPDNLIESEYFTYKLCDGNFCSVSTQVSVQIFGDLGLTSNTYTVPLLSVRPNPFNPVTTISFGLPFESEVCLNVYDIEGRLVTSLTSGLKVAGNHTIEWNAEGYPSGVYFVKLNAGEFTQTQKLMLVK